MKSRLKSTGFKTIIFKNYDFQDRNKIFINSINIELISDHIKYS